MHINVMYDGNINDLPAGFVAALQKAVNDLTSNISNDITFNLHVGYGEVHGAAINPNNFFQYEPNFTNVSFADFKAALASHSSGSAEDVAALASLAINPLPNGTQLKISPVEALALGLQTGGTPDVYIGFNKTTPFDYDSNGGITNGQFDFYAAAVSAITYAMGKGFTNAANTIAPLQLFDYASAPVNGNAVHQFNPFGAGYFSLDSGTTNLKWFYNPGGNASWRPDQGDDAFNGLYASGHTLPLTPVDLKVLDVLGFNLGSAPPPPPPPGGTTQGEIMWKAMSDTVPTDAQINTIWPKFATDQHDSYAKMGVTSPDVGVFEAFGLAFAHEAKFGTHLGNLSNADFAKVAYHDAFGTDANADQIKFVNDHVDFFSKIYADAHAYGADDPVVAQLLGRAATFGDLIGVAEGMGVHTHTIA